MWKFLKKIFSEKDREVTVLILDESDPDSSDSFSISSAQIVKLASFIVAISVAATTLLFFITPLGSLYQQRQDAGIIEEIEKVAGRLDALQDSLDARDQQLKDLKLILRINSDTTFSTDSRLIRSQPDLNSEADFLIASGSASGSATRVSLMTAGLLRDAPQLPAPYPIEGELTQLYSASDNHYGIDIAAKSGTGFSSIADGSVIKAGWTINFGYVIYVQHNEGIVSVYKHGSKLFKQEGDIVLKGDLLGEIGDRGILSSGSHLHLEIWKNGVSQDPLMYLIK